MLFNNRKLTNLIVIHCAATRPHMDIGSEEIDRWHRENGYSACGYHVVIRRDGTIETAETGDKPRPIEAIGAHCYGYNSRSVGVCMVGGVDDKLNPENNFTDAQWVTLRSVILQLRALYGEEIEIRGHTELNPKKACPSFSVPKWLALLPKFAGKTIGHPIPKPKPKLPPQAYHDVVAGDTLWRISRNNNTTVTALRALNPQIANFIRPGDRLTLPD